MTTPERLKRRQIRIGLCLIILAIFTIAQGLYFQYETHRQQVCFEAKFTELSKVLAVRGDLIDQESKASRRIWLVYAHAAGLVKNDPTKPLKPRQQHRLQRQLVAALLNYQAVTKHIQQERDQHPIDPYPAGTCDKG